MAISAVVFDLGGVLVNLEGQPFRNEWLSTPMAHEDSWHQWLKSPVVRSFDSGKIGAREFAEMLIREMQMNVDASEFIRWITDWPKEIFDGVFEMLDELSTQVTLGVFSNITELHWPRYYEQLKAHGAIEHYFASYQMGLVKPDIAAFEAVLENIGLPAGEIVFIDDNRLNVDSANQLGMIGRHARGIAEVRSKLHQLGLLSG